MKFLLLSFLLISGLSFADEYKDMRYEKFATQVNSFRTNASAICGKLDDATDKATCVLVIEERISGQIKKALSQLSEDHRTDAKTSFKKFIKEKECVKGMQSQFDVKGWTYNGSETCDQLESAKCVNSYTKLLVDAGQVLVGSTCDELKLEWKTYQESL